MKHNKKNEFQVRDIDMEIIKNNRFSFLFTMWSEEHNTKNELRTINLQQLENLEKCRGGKDLQVEVLVGLKMSFNH